MGSLWKAVRYSAVGISLAGIFSIISGCSSEDSIRAIILFFIMLLMGGGGVEEAGTGGTQASAPFTFGNDPIDRTNQASTPGQTCVILENAATGSGTVDEWSVFVFANSDNSSIKIKVFRDVGANYELVGESALETPAHTNTLQTFATNIPNVQAGDLLGFYVTGCSGFGCQQLQIESDTTSLVILDCIGGDVTSTTAKTAFDQDFQNPKRLSVQASGM